MKKNQLLKFLCLTTLFYSSQASAYKFVIYTDETITTKSLEVAEIMKKTYPLNKFDIEVEIVRVPQSELECSSSLGIERLVTCENLDDIQAKAMKRGGDQALIVKNMSKWGGSASIGGGVPVITSGTSARGMLHEYMHTLGLCDEYEYAASEAGFYCSVTNKNTNNLAFIAPKGSYAGDFDARNQHSSEIPWYGSIFTTTPITTGEIYLGTGVVDRNNIAAVNNTSMGQKLGTPTGLYRGKVCNKATPVRVTWNPSGEVTIMENHEAGLGASLEVIVEKLMISKGSRKKLQFEEPKENIEPRRSNIGISEEGGGITVEPEPEVAVNNTGRNFFKSLFDWIVDIFQQFKNGFSR